MRGRSARRALGQDEDRHVASLAQTLLAMTSMLD